MEKNKIEKVEKNYYMNLMELPNKAAYMDINERMDISELKRNKVMANRI